MDEPPEVAPELDGHRSVEPVKAAQLAPHAGVAAAHLRHQRVDRVARSELQQQEQARQDDRKASAGCRETPKGQKETAHVLRCRRSRYRASRSESQRGMLWWFFDLLAGRGEELCAR